ncbi:Chitinase 4 [Collariella sp. IMI 366227]|nr:Chitinase 4 [Collariella sp. IMI 366227]
MYKQIPSPGIYRNIQPQDLFVDKVTHLLYAFADIAPDGEVKSADSYADIVSAVATDAGCQRFCDSAVNFVKGKSPLPSFPQPFSHTQHSHPNWGLDGIDRAMADYTARGVPARKINLGMPLYGQAFQKTYSLEFLFTGVGNGTVELGVWLYKELPRGDGVGLWDDMSKATYSYDTVAMEMASYDSVGSVLDKMAYLLKKGLGEHVLGGKRG